MASALDPFPMPLVETEWLARRLGAPGLAIVDGSWRMPGKGRARHDFDVRRIEGAQFFDIDEIADRETDLPHMLPSPQAFEAAMRAMGIASADSVVVYDDQGIFSAARVWWTFRAMGHRRVSVLNGGLKAWLAEGRPVVRTGTKPAAARYEAALREGAVASSRDVAFASAEGARLILDARPSGRFEGREPEPRPGLRQGRIPGSASLPFDETLAPDGRLLPRDALAARFENAGLDARPVIATCGSGVTAAVLVLALAVLGRDDVALYDGAFAEWGRLENDPARFPVIEGKAS
jgi:thiosulfate/3-mercaptopyruvate sulfurtransferase